MDRERERGIEKERDGQRKIAMERVEKEKDRQRRMVKETDG